MDKTSLGDRMKLYEGKEAFRMFMPLLPIVARLDGRSFSTYTKRFDRPFDARMTSTMQATTKKLIEHTGADIGYTQSDEITLVFMNDSNKSQPFFNGKIQKMVSILASACTIYFNDYAGSFMPGAHAGKFPMFDCRVYQTPTLMEAYNALIWRQQDAKRNSIQSLARTRFSHIQCHGEDQAKLLEMLSEKGVDWHTYPSKFKYGTFFGKKRVVKGYSKDELERLPLKHEARSDPDFKVERSVVGQLDLPYMSNIVNKVEVFRHGHTPFTLDRSLPEGTATGLLNDK